VKVWKKGKWKMCTRPEGWQKTDMTRGAERNRKDKEGKRKMYETPTSRRKKTCTSGTQGNLRKREWSRLEEAMMWRTGEETGKRGHS
jgi:hypothetical protein